MSFKYINSGLKKMCALILVGTIAGGVSYGRMVSTGNDNDFVNGYYSDEDVKKYRENLIRSIEFGGKGKTFEKKRDFVPKGN